MKKKKIPKIDKRRFLCYWGKGYINAPKTSITGIHFFSEDNGYSHTDILQIGRLKKGQKWVPSFGSPIMQVHSVKRIK